MLHQGDAAAAGGRGAGAHGLVGHRVRARRIQVLDGAGVVEVLERRAVDVEFGQVPGAGGAQVQEPVGEQARGAGSRLEDAAPYDAQPRPGPPVVGVEGGGVGDAVVEAHADARLVGHRRGQGELQVDDEAEPALEFRVVADEAAGLVEVDAVLLLLGRGEFGGRGARPVVEQRRFGQRQHASAVLARVRAAGAVHGAGGEAVGRGARAAVARRVEGLRHRLVPRGDVLADAEDLLGDDVGQLVQGGELPAAVVRGRRLAQSALLAGPLAAEAAACGGHGDGLVHAGDLVVDHLAGEGAQGARRLRGERGRRGRLLDERAAGEQGLPQHRVGGGVAAGRLVFLDVGVRGRVELQPQPGQQRVQVPGPLGEVSGPAELGDAGQGGADEDGHAHGVPLDDAVGQDGPSDAVHHGQLTSAKAVQ
ncbi:hypothetical protein RB200_41460 [Streptomyces sp. PmtG]